MTGQLRPEVKAKWLEALRSGEYQQGQEFLGYVDGDERHYCCLGVLCDLAVKEERIASFTRPGTATDGHETILVYGANGAATTMPPREVVEWAYGAGADAVANYSSTWVLPAREDEGDGDPTVGLADLNDDYHLTFEQIADRIEESL